MEKDATIEETMVQIKDQNKIWINFIPTCYLRQFFNAEKIYANLENWSVGTRPQITTPLLCQIHKKKQFTLFCCKISCVATVVFACFVANNFVVIYALFVWIKSSQESCPWRKKDT